MHNESDRKVFKKSRAMTSAGRSIGYGLVLSLVLAAIAFLVDRSADPIIDEFEKVIVPCQHGGEWVSAKETCR